MKRHEGKDVQKHLRLWLLSGKTITHNQAQKMWGTNRLAEYVRRLRHDEHLDIKMEMVYEDGDSFGVYSYKAPKKVNRITAGTYART